MISLGFGKKSKPLLGIDISSSCVKVVDLLVQGDKILLKGFDIMPLPHDVVVEKSIVDADAVGGVILRSVERLGTKNKHAAVCITGASVITKVIGVSSSLRGEQLESQIEIEADQHIPFPLEEVALDFNVIGPSGKSDQMHDVLLIAGRKEAVDATVDALDVAGLTPKVVDYEPYAQQRALVRVLEKHEIEQHAVVVFVDVGANSLDFFAMHDGQIIYSRDQAFGGKDLVASLGVNFGLAPDEAVRALNQPNLLPENAEQLVLAGFREQVVRQITRSLQLFFAATNYNDVDVIVLAGRVAAMPGLLEAAQQDLGTRTLVASVLDFVDASAVKDQVRLKQNGSALMLAVGLALWGSDDA